MTIGDDLAQLAVNVRKPRGTHPKGWEPGFVWDGERGVVTAEPQFEPLQPGEDYDFGHVIRFFGYDPEQFEVEGAVDHRAWQQKVGEGYLFYYRARIVRRGTAEAIGADLEELCARVARRRPRKPADVAVAPAAGLVVAIADVQIGKSDGDGVEGTVDRLNAMIGLVEDRWKALRKVGVPLEVLYPCFMGDLFEGCSGHYAQQSFRTALDNRAQRKVLREFIDAALDRWSLLAPAVAVQCVGGNHGEERQNGKSDTTFSDNKDVAVVEDVAYGQSKNPGRYSNVSFAIPDDDLTRTFAHDGLIVGLAHGHQAGFGSGDPRTKIHNWWRGQMDGQQAIGDADILISAHYHHPWMIRRGARTHFGCPALDGGSDWFRNQTGMNAPPSTLSFVVTGEGWSHMELLGQS